MDSTALEAWIFGWLALSYVVGVVVHEMGHAVLAWAAGLHPRLISIGLGRILLRIRLGEAWLVVRAWPVAGYVLSPPPMPGRRVRRAAAVAGGPLANALLLAVAGAIYCANPAGFGDGHLWAQMSLGAFSVMQAFIFVVALIPARRRTAVRSTASDGLKLWRLIVNPAPGSLPATHAVLMRDVLPPGAADPPLSPFSAEIVFQTARPDRRRDAWAARDAADALQRILQQDTLPGLERAFVQSLLVADTLLVGKTGVHLASLDAWSRQALELVPMRQQRILRGGVLAALGHFREAEALLTPAANTEAKGTLSAIACAFLAQALAGQGDDTAAQAWMRRAHAAVTTAQKPMLLPVLARLEAGVPQVVQPRAGLPSEAIAR